MMSAVVFLCGGLAAAVESLVGTSPADATTIVPEGKGHWRLRLMAEKGTASVFFDLYGTMPIFCARVR